MLRLNRRASHVLLVMLAVSAWPGPATAEKLTVVLDWFMNPDHAPLVIARENGIFAAAGLEVEFIEPADPNDPPKLVAAGRGEIGVSYQPQLHLQVQEGLPLVRIGTLVATPLNTLVVMRDGPVASVADLRGKKIGYSVGGFEDAVLGAMLERHGVSPDEVELVNVNFALSPALLSGQVDAVIGAFRNFELNQMDILGRPGRAFYPEEHGVPAYDELIYVVHRASLARPAIRSFLDAVETATNWLVNHPDEGWEVFKSAYPDLDDELNRRAWRDTLPRLAHRPAALDRGRYSRFAKFLERSDLINNPSPVSNYAVDISATEQ